MIARILLGVVGLGLFGLLVGAWFVFSRDCFPAPPGIGQWLRDFVAVIAAFVMSVGWTCRFWPEEKTKQE